MKRKTIISLSIFFIISLILPIIIYIANFHKLSISNKNEDWANFSNYIGGTINTITSIFSLIILSYLTFTIGKQSNEENKKINILLKKIEAYDQLSIYFPKINQALININSFPETYLKKLANEDCGYIQIQTSLFNC